jgi:hypothetical protein
MSEAENIELTACAEDLERALAQFKAAMARLCEAFGQRDGQAGGEPMPSQQASQVPHNALRRPSVPRVTMNLPGGAKASNRRLSDRRHSAL